MAASLSVSAQQFLPVKSIVNARDLGGYAVRDGRKIRDGLLLRAAHIADATDADIRFLSGLPVSKIVDFRKEEEKPGKLDREIPGAEYIALPIDATGNAASRMSESEVKKFTKRKRFDIKKVILIAAFNENAREVARNMYPILLFDEESQKQLAGFFRIVVDTENGAVLFHCTQGKDRTGIASALLLSALGADRETIVADFDATNHVYEKDVRKYSRRVRFLGGKEDEMGVVKAFLGANTDNFVRALEEVDSRYGSLEAYLKGPMGITDEDIQTLRGRYLE